MRHQDRVVGAAILSALGIMVGTTEASVHLWHIEEVFSNADGSIQFIEIHTTQPGQQFFLTGGNNSRFISKTPANVTVNTYFLPSDGTAPTANHHVLIGTSNLAAAAGVTPDFVMPANFLLAGGGNLDFVSSVFGTFNAITYPAFPNNGTTYLAEDAVFSAPGGSPTNYAGVIGAVPEPATMALLAAGAGVLLRRHRR